jgi:formylmethanofuran dehydrogenase subunit E
MYVDEEFNKVVEFHGHVCPGLAIGYRVAKYIKGHCDKSEDEELVAIVENNSCSVDAIQRMLSCTFGKGNLIFKDFGKQVFTFYCRGNGKALRIYFKGEMPKRMGELQEKRSKNQLTSADQRELEGLRVNYIQYILNPHDSLTHTWSMRNLIASSNLNMVDMGSEGCFIFGTTIL